METNPTSIHEDTSRIAVSCGVGHRYGLGLALLWLWRRLAAMALIQPIAWELPYAAGATLKGKKKKSAREASPGRGGGRALQTGGGAGRR